MSQLVCYINIKLSLSTQSLRVIGQSAAHDIAILQSAKLGQLGHLLRILNTFRDLTEMGLCCAILRKEHCV